MIEVTNLKRGMRIELEGDPYQVMDVTFQTPSARGTSLLVKIKIRNLRTKQVFDKSFRGGEKLIEPDFMMHPAQFLFRQGDEFHFMDQDNYDQFILDREMLSDAADFLTDGLECRSLLHNGQVFGIELPHVVELKVIETEPVIAGATAKAQTKAATLETGAVIQVPPYLQVGEVIRVDTRDGRFVERAKR